MYYNTNNLNEGGESLKEAAIFTAEGFEEIEAFTPIDILRRAGVTVKAFSLSNSLAVKGSHHITFNADDSIDNFNLNDCCVIILPGGQPGTNNLANDYRVINIIKKAVFQNLTVAAICAAPSVLLKADVLDNHCVTCHNSVKHLFKNFVDSPVVVSGNFITSQSAATALPWAFQILQNINVNPDTVKNGMHFLNFMHRVKNILVLSFDFDADF